MSLKGLKAVIHPDTGCMVLVKKPKTPPISDLIGWLKLATDMLEYPNDYAKADTKMIAEVRAAIRQAESKVTI